LSAVATALRVTSSGVGPSPPVRSTASARASACFNASPIASTESPIVVCHATTTLASSSARARNTKFVSSVRPERTSLPMVTISMRMGRPGGAREAAFGGHLRTSERGRAGARRDAKPSRGTRALRAATVFFAFAFLVTSIAARPHVARGGIDDFQQFMDDVPQRVEAMVLGTPVEDEAAARVHEAALAASEEATPIAASAPGGPEPLAGVIAETAGRGVSFRSACHDEARQGGLLEEGSSVTLVAHGTDACTGWSLVATADGVQTWVRDGVVTWGASPVLEDE